jgi:hypothetical protein
VSGWADEMDRAGIGDPDRTADDTREALRAVLRDFDREPTEEYLDEAERIFAAARRDPEAVAQCPKCYGREHPAHVGRCNMPTGQLGVVPCYCTFSSARRDPEPVASAHPDDGHEHHFTCIRCGVNPEATIRGTEAGLDAERLAYILANTTVFGTLFPRAARELADRIFEADARLASADSEPS